MQLRTYSTEIQTNGKAICQIASYTFAQAYTFRPKLTHKLRSNTLQSAMNFSKKIHPLVLTLFFVKLSVVFLPSI